MAGLGPDKCGKFHLFFGFPISVPLKTKTTNLSLLKVLDNAVTIKDRCKKIIVSLADIDFSKCSEGGGYPIKNILRLLLQKSIDRKSC